MSLFFTAINFHDDVFSSNYHLGIVVHFGTNAAFNFLNKLSTRQFPDRQVDFLCVRNVFTD